MADEVQIAILIDPCFRSVSDPNSGYRSNTDIYRD